MIPAWTGDVVKEMHLNGINIYEMAQKLKIDRSYRGKVLNGQKTPAGAEERFRRAVAEIIAERNEKNDS